MLVETDKDGEFSKEVEHWYKADLDGNKILNSTEFLAFIHPEHNKRTLQTMVNDMMPNFDKDGDKVGKTMFCTELNFFSKWKINQHKISG